MILLSIWKMVKELKIPKKPQSSIWMPHSHLLSLFCPIYNFPTDANLQNTITIRSYSYTNLLIGYGPNKEVTVSIFWCTKTKEYKMIFNGGNTAINAHTLMRDQLQTHLNRHHNLSHIVQIIADTYQPLSSLAKLPIIPQLGIPVSLISHSLVFDGLHMI